MKISTDSKLKVLKKWASGVLSKEQKEKASFSSWRKHHFRYLAHHRLCYEDTYDYIINNMSRKVRHTLFTHTPNAKIMGCTVRKIETYLELMNVTKDLSVCSAVRTDLVSGFLSGEHLRYVIKHNNKIIGVIAIIPFDRNNGIDFDVYGLGKGHKQLTNSKNLEGRVFRAFLKTHEEAITSSLILTHKQAA